MRGLLLSCLIVAATGRLLSPAFAAGVRENYPGPEAVSGDLKQLAGSLPGGSLVNYGTSREGRPLDALRVTRAAGDPETLPALLILAGVDPERLASAELALAIARTAGAKPAAGPDPLARAVLYVIADANPDARARLLAGGRGATNARPLDTDHDGAVDEDGPDDLDGNGRAGWMRVYRTGGSHRPDSADARASLKADPDKGNFGVFDLLPEGKDDDGDGDVNEDGPGGVDLNENFPHAYKMFTPESGPYQMSEPESKALADFVIARPNIAAAIVFAPDDVLIEAPKGVKPEAPRAGGFGFGLPPGLPENIRNILRDRSAVKGIVENDAPFYARAAERYKALVGLSKQDPAPETAGTIGDWLRYQRGVFALVTPGWTFPDSAGTPKKETGGEPKDGGASGDEAKADSTGAASAETDSMSTSRTGGEHRTGADGTRAMKKEKEPEKPREARMLRYLDDTDRQGFAPWKEVNHPAFPGKKVEVGGFDPLAFSVPPRADLDSLSARHARFAAEILTWLPGITLETPIVERLDGGAYRIRTEIANPDYLPTALDQSVRSQKARPIRVDLNVPSGRILTGRSPTLIYQLEGGGGRQALEWVIQAAAGSRVTIEAKAPRTGAAVQEVKLP